MGNSETIKLELDYKTNLFSINYAKFDLSSRIEGRFNTDDASVVLKPLNLVIEHNYEGSAYSIGKNFRLIETNKNRLGYEIGIGYHDGKLLTKNAIKVAFF